MGGQLLDWSCSWVWFPAEIFSGMRSSILRVVAASIHSFNSASIVVEHKICVLSFVFVDNTKKTPLRFSINVSRIYGGENIFYGRKRGARIGQNARIYCR